MGRKQLVTAERTVEVLESADRPFASTNDIAEGLDVTPQAVRNNREELAECDDLCSAKVNRGVLYWLPSGEEPPEEADTPTDEPKSGGGKGILNRLFDGLPALSASSGLLVMWTALVGLSFGVGLSTVLFGPPVGVALLAVWGLLVAALVALGVATVHELQTSTQQATIGADTA